MSRPVARVPRIAFNLAEAAEAAGCVPELLKAQVFHGYLRAKRTSQPYRWRSFGLSQTGGRYLIGVDDLGRWLAECGEASDAGLWLGWDR